MTQKERLLDYLKEKRTITTLQGMTDLGIYRLSERIRELRAAGHAIESDRLTVHNRFGDDCRVALYRYSEAA